MVDAETILKQVLADIAEEQEFQHYETDLKMIYSGGANYTSQLYSITLSAPGKDDLKLFAKVASIGEKIRSMTTLQVFETEIMFYTKIATKYRELEERHNFPEEVRVVLPKYYGGSTEYMKETLVLEELSVKGYQPFDRFKCFNWEYASQCVSALARLHALSVAFERDEPEQFANMVEKLVFQFPVDEMKHFMEKGISNALEVTTEEYKGRLAKFLENNMSEEKFVAYYNPTRKIILNHGDFRPSNIMHRTDKNGKLEVVLVDFQIIQKSNPLTDLMYFFISGSDEEFRGQYRQRYFDHYYEEFSATLRRLEINPDEVYPKHDFDGDIETFFPFGLVLGVVTLPIVTVDEASAPKVEDGIDLDNFDMKISDQFRMRFNALVRDYVKWGLL